MGQMTDLSNVLAAEVDELLRNARMEMRNQMLGQMMRYVVGEAKRNDGVLLGQCLRAWTQGLGVYRQDPHDDIDGPGRIQDFMGRPGEDSQTLSEDLAKDNMEDQILQTATVQSLLAGASQRDVAQLSVRTSEEERYRMASTHPRQEVVGLIR